MSGFKYLTCLLFVALLSVTVQAEALIGYHSTLHRHMKRNKLQKCTQDLASQRFKDGHYTTLTAAICYRAGKGFKVYDGTEDHFRTGKLGTCYMKGLFGSRYSYE
ncbi:uncharacterized protein UDID_04718 [Ustilago sp. UG-2017a]|nr:uncharacterized protein UDID_04718 [Ustilago sp. UG-2017a]